MLAESLLSYDARMDVRPRDVAVRLPMTTVEPALETLGQLTGQFAHDINNMLSAILTGAELAAQIEADERVRGLLASMIEAIRRQTAFTAAMAQAGRRCECACVLDVHELVETCGEELREALDPCALELRLEAADPIIRCDPGFLRTALLHLTTNARAAMPGKGRLLLATRNRESLDGGTAGGGFLQLTAVDDGAGMTDEVRRRAFEPFFSTRKGANGLGLSQVRDLAYRAGGTVSLETTVGQGTAIRLMLPLAAGRSSSWHGT